MKINIEFEENPNFNYNPLMTFRFLRNVNSIAIFLQYFNKEIFNNITHSPNSQNNTDTILAIKEDDIKIVRWEDYMFRKYAVVLYRCKIGVKTNVYDDTLIKNGFKKLFDYFNHNPINKPVLSEPIIKWGSSYNFNKDEDENISNLIETNTLKLIKDINELNLIEKENQNNRLKELNNIELKKFLTQEYGEFSIW